jgi:hypothetical protein
VESVFANNDQQRTQCTQCGQKVPVCLAFCEKCAAPAPHTVFAYRLLKPPANCVLFVLIFYLAGYHGSVWAVFLYVVYLYLHSIGFSLRTNRWVRDATMLLLLLGGFITILDFYFDLAPAWLALVCATAVIRILLSNAAFHRQITVFSLIGLLFLQGEAHLVDIRNEPELKRGIEILWASLSGHSDISFWSSVIALGSWRFAWVFCVTLLVVAIQQRYRQARSIKVGVILARPRQFAEIAAVDWPGKLDEIIKCPPIIRPLFHMLLGTFRVLAKTWAIFATKTLTLVYKLLVGLTALADGVLRVSARCGLWSWEVLKGIYLTFTESIADTTRALSISCTVLIIPLLLHVLTLKLGYRMSEAIVTNLLHPGSTSLLRPAMAFAAVFFSSMYFAGWMVRPMGTADRILWEICDFRVLFLFEDSARQHLRVISRSVTNYSENFGPILFFSYVVTLGVFDFIGFTTGRGPYQFGWAMGLCLAITALTSVVWLFIRKRSLPI